MSLIGISIEEISNKRDAEALESSILTLLSWGYDIISLTELQNRIGYSNFYDKAVTYTFPQGYKSIKEYALPVFKRYNVPFTIFLSSNYIGDQSRWEKRPKEMLTVEDLLALKKTRLSSFGSSGLSYINLSKVESDVVEEELSKSKMFLEKLTADKIVFFLWPFGIVPERGYELLKKANYFSGFCRKQGTLNFSFKEFHKIPLLPYKKPPSFLHLYFNVLLNEVGGLSK